MTFRGPRIELKKPFILCLGGSETFGKFATDPYPARLGDRIGRSVINMGAMNAGVDLLLNDRAIRRAIEKADQVVLQVPGASNMSNRFFTVHPRRNDRFLKASRMMQSIFRDVDFTEFHFTRHMLSALCGKSEDRFSLILEELRSAWVSRMATLLNGIDAPVQLLWMSHRTPDENEDCAAGMGYDPLFVTREMLDEIKPLAVSLIEHIWPNEGVPPEDRGLLFGRNEEAAARVMPGASDYEAVSQALARVLN